MAKRKTRVSSRSKAETSDTEKSYSISTGSAVKTETVMPKWRQDEKDAQTDALDPQEEKILDWILKAVVAFVLGWLGLSVLLVLGGLFGLWK